MTRVPHALPQVSGVINLRGEVTTVVDLRQTLGLPPVETSRRHANVDRSLAGRIDRLDRRSRRRHLRRGSLSAIVPPPPNVDSVDGRFFHGVCQRKTEIILVLESGGSLSLSDVDLQTVEQFDCDRILSSSVSLSKLYSSTFVLRGGKSMSRF